MTRAAVQLDEVADDREPEAESAVAPLRPGVPLAEALEDVGQEVGSDARCRCRSTTISTCESVRAQVQARPIRLRA